MSPLNRPWLQTDEEDDAPIDDDFGTNLPRRARSSDRSPRRVQRRLTFRDSTEDSQPRLTSEFTETTDKEGAYPTSYRPARYEGVWLTASLRSFFEQELIEDVLSQVKGGKEASVYRCRAHPRLGVEFLAAKVYRPRKFRNLRNDALYREGRAVLAASGSPISPHERRAMLAIRKKTSFGEKLQHTSWLMHEYTILDRLFRAGASVPRPYAANENAILMTYFGDDDGAAPTLNNVSLSAGDAASILGDVLHNVELMLSIGLIHGDLSAYNLLFWDGRPVLIDFPQGTSSQGNGSAALILRRDLQRVGEYFSRQGVPVDVEALYADLTQRFDVPE